jgi:hypothetical protein
LHSQRLTPEEYRHASHRGEQAGRLHRTVEMLLFLARSDAEAALPDVTAVRLHPGCTTTCRVGPITRAADLRVDADGAEDLERAHAPLLGQVVDAAGQRL